MTDTREEILARNDAEIALAKQQLAQYEGWLERARREAQEVPVDEESAYRIGCAAAMTGEMHQQIEARRQDLSELYAFRSRALATDDLDTLRLGYPAPAAMDAGAPADFQW